MDTQAGETRGRGGEEGEGGGAEGSTAAEAAASQRELKAGLSKLAVGGRLGTGPHVHLRLRHAEV